jgi:hypothetical protein
MTGYFGVNQSLERGEIPSNRATQGLVEGIAAAHAVLGDEKYITNPSGPRI